MTPLAQEAATEKEFQKSFTDLLDALGWDWLHIYPLQDRHKRWRTPTSGPLAVGFPDVLMMRGGYIGVTEVKSEKGVVQPEQDAMLRHFVTHSPFDLLWIVRASDDLQQLARWLQCPSTAPRIHGWSL